jgi:hypothetical protein
MVKEKAHFDSTGAETRTKDKEFEQLIKSILKEKKVENIKWSRKTFII